jgi:DNA-binding NarL/FixJ family response regulator
MAVVGGDPAHRKLPLLDRDGELERLRDAVSRTQSGSGEVVLVEGPPGIGKTRLLDAVVQMADAASLKVLRARAGELEGGLGFSVVRELFGVELERASPQERDELLAGAARLAAPIFGLEPPARQPSPEGTTSAALHGLFWLSANLAERTPFVLVVDDVHWADGASLQFLAHLARRVPDLPVSMVLAARPHEGEADPIVTTAIAGGATTLALGPLGPAATTRLVEEAFDDEVAPEFAEACHRATGGNPFLLHELLHELLAEQTPPTSQASGTVEELSPEAVARATLARLARLPDEAVRVARAVAVFRGPAQVRQVAAVSDVDPETVADMADALARADLLADARPLEFRHPLVRTAVYSDMPRAVRGEAHARAARVLSQDGAPVDAIALHLLHTEPGADDATVATLRRAATQAADAGSPETGVEYLRRALAEPPPPESRRDVLAELGGLEVRAARPEAVEHLLSALAATTDPIGRSEIVLQLVWPLMLAGHPERALALLEETLPLVAAIDREVALRLELELLMAARMSPALRPEMERVRELARLPGDTVGERCMLGFVSFALYWSEAGAAEVLALANRAVRGGQLMEEVSPAWHGAHWPELTLIGCDELDEADRVSARALEMSAAVGSTLGFLLSTTNRLPTLVRRGALDETIADSRMVLEGSLTSEYALMAVTALVYLLAALVEQGELDEADELLRQYGMDGDIPEVGVNNLLLYVRCQLHLARGRLDEALADAREGDLRSRRWGRSFWIMNPRLALAQCLAAQGDTTTAREIVRQEVDEARRFGSRYPLGAALRAAGAIEDGEAGLAFLEEAVTVLAGSPSRLEYAKALVDYGAALRRANQRSAAKEFLAPGLDLAHRFGAKPLVDRAETELRATGARPRRQVLTGVDALTPSERRIALLAAEGVSNRDIAQRLFVTLRTVEGHLTSAYRKLGISSRQGLQEALED